MRCVAATTLACEAGQVSQVWVWAMGLDPRGSTSSGDVTRLRATPRGGSHGRAVSSSSPLTRRERNKLISHLAPGAGLDWIELRPRAGRGRETRSGMRSFPRASVAYYRPNPMTSDRQCAFCSDSVQYSSAGEKTDRYSNIEREKANSPPPNEDHPPAADSIAPIGDTLCHGSYAR